MLNIGPFISIKTNHNYDKRTNYYDTKATAIAVAFVMLKTYAFLMEVQRTT